jgi:hypothetical protein
MQCIKTPHVLLAHNTVGLGSCTYPGAFYIYKRMLDITVDEAFAKAEQAVRV